MRKKPIVICVIILALVVVVLALIPFLVNGPILPNEKRVSNRLAYMNMRFNGWKKKGYTTYGKRYPHALVNPDGKGSTNAGTFAGVYYANVRGDEWVTFISYSSVAADFRADGNMSMQEGKGFYIPSYYDFSENMKLKYKDRIYFSCKPFSGYWFGLMNYYGSGNTKIPYNLGYARDHYALIAIPADYGASGEHTFIINESGTVYSKDLGRSKYIDTYPGPDPTKYGWESMKVADPSEEWNRRHQF